MYDLLRTVNTARRLVKTAQAAPKQAKQAKATFQAADTKQRIWLVAKIAGLAALVFGAWCYREGRKPNRHIYTGTNKNGKPKYFIGMGPDDNVF